ncbi:MAG TPA: hypothetical protein ENF52_04680 [Chloroflexi bacterium]|nr:hypothetical protein [Chloroflexota bacterium]
MGIRVFIGGIMQGSRRDGGIDDQNYRDKIAAVLRRHLPAVEILDPWVLYPDSVAYDFERAKRTFFDLTALAGEADVLVAYLPEASMGTAIEMWSAYQTQVPIYTISPLIDNWVVMLLSTQVFPDIPAFAHFVADGGLDTVKCEGNATATG